MQSIGRRYLSKTLLAGAATAALPGAVAHAAPAAIRWVWWGNPARDRRTAEVIKLFEARHADIRVTGESSAWPDYWPKLAVQVAGRNAADVIQIDYRFLVEYVRRGALAPINDLIPDPLNLDGFDRGEIDAGTIGGKTYGVSVGANAFAIQYNKAVFQRLGVPEPQFGWSWDDYVESATAISKASPQGFYGAGDGSRQDDIIAAFLRQRGRDFFTADGQLDFSADDMADFYAFWAGLRQKGIVTPAAVTATERGVLTTNVLTNAKAAMSFIPVNELMGAQGLMHDPVGVATIPAAKRGGYEGNYLKPAQLMTISSRSAMKRQAATLIQFIVADPASVSILQIDRGVPESAGLRTMLEPKLGPLDQVVVNYIDHIGKTAGPLPPPPPEGAGQILQLAPRIADKIAFGQVSVKDGAREFHDTLATLVRRT
jgi:multiple sugar transport system substrate-binding protein